MLLPKIYFATPAEADVTTLVHALNKYVVNPIIIFIFVLALLYFLYGLFEFLANTDSDDKRTTGKSHMLWGVVGMTIMIGVFFIMGLIANTFNTGLSSSNLNSKEPINLQQ